MTLPAVELRSVTKAFGNFTALRELDLVVPPNSFFCLLGASGSGKSTALRLIAGLEQVTRGQVLISGELVNGVPSHRRPVNTVFQSYGLFPRMSVFDNVAYGLRSRKVGRAEVQRRVVDALGMVRMNEHRQRRPAQLSGGQQQRVALARALVNEPSVLLLDEPLGALDLQLRRDMQEELVRLHARTGTTFVHVTHDQEESFACATHVGVMSGGQLLQVGSPEELYRHPRSAFVAGFVGSANRIPVRVEGREGDEYVVRGPAGWLARAGSWDHWAIGADALLVVRPEDVDVLDPTEGSSGDWVQGRLLARVVTGSTVRLTVEVAGLSLAVERSASPSGDLSARPGDAVIVRVSRETGWLVAAGEAAPGDIGVTSGRTAEDGGAELTSKPLATQPEGAHV